MEKRSNLNQPDKIKQGIDDAVQAELQNTDGQEVQKRGDRQGLATRVFVGNLSFRTSWRYLKDYMRKAGKVLYADVFSDNTGRSKGCGLVEFETEEEAKRAVNELNGTTLDGRALFIRHDDASQAKFDKDNFQQRDQKERSKGSRSPPAREERGEGRTQERGGLRGGFRGGFRGETRGGRGGFSRGGGDRREGEYRGGLNDRSENRQQQSDKPGFDSRTSGWQLIIKNLAWGISWQQLKDAFKEFGTVIRADVPQDHSGRSAGYGFVIFENEEDAKKAIDTMDGASFNGRNITVKFSSGK